MTTAGTFTDQEIIQSTQTNQHDSDNNDEEEETEVPVISSIEAKSSMTGLRKLFEQSKMDEETCNTIFKAISKLMK